MICTHTHSYWAGIIRTCPRCFASYDKSASGMQLRENSRSEVEAEGLQPDGDSRDAQPSVGG